MSFRNSRKIKQSRVSERSDQGRFSLMKILDRGRKCFYRRRVCDYPSFQIGRVFEMNEFSCLTGRRKVSLGTLCDKILGCFYYTRLICNSVSCIPIIPSFVPRPYQLEREPLSVSCVGRGGSGDFCHVFVFEWNVQL